jgi:hypothetical protein
LPWSTPFEDPIGLPDGRKLVTLKDAADYITKLPKKESALSEWQTTIEVLMLCSRGGPSQALSFPRLGAQDHLRKNKLALHRDVLGCHRTIESNCPNAPACRSTQPRLKVQPKCEA